MLARKTGTVTLLQQFQDKLAAIKLKTYYMFDFSTLNKLPDIL